MEDNRSVTPSPGMGQTRWVRHFVEVLSLTALVIAGGIVGSSSLQYPGWKGQLFLLSFGAVLALDSWGWRWRPPKNETTVHTGQYRTLAILLALGRIGSPFWLVWYASNSRRPLGGLSLLIVIGIAQWVRRLFKRDLIAANS